MKVQITTLKNNKLLREFADDTAFLGYIQYNNSKIKNIEILGEALLPELQKGTEIAKPSISKGWAALPKSAFGGIDKAEKSDSMEMSSDKPIATEFRYEPTKPSDKAVKDDANTKTYLDGAKTEQPKVEQKPAEKEVKPEPQKEMSKEDTDTTVDTKKTDDGETPAKEEKSEDKEEKKEEVKEAVNPELNTKSEDYKRGYEDGQYSYECGHYVPAEESDPESKEYEQGYEDGYEDAQEGINKYSDNEDIDYEVDSYLKDLGINTDTLKGQKDFYVATTNDDFIQGGFNSKEEAQQWIYNYCNANALNPNDYVVYEDIYEGFSGNLKGELKHFGYGTPEQIKKAKIIAKVKGMEGNTFHGLGKVSKEDLEHFDEYKAKYDEIFGSDEDVEVTTKLWKNQ